MARSQPDAPTVIVVDECRERAIEAGCREFAAKPIEMKEPAELIARNLRSNVSQH